MKNRASQTSQTQDSTLQTEQNQISLFFVNNKGYNQIFLCCLKCKKAWVLLSACCSLTLQRGGKEKL